MATKSELRALALSRRDAIAPAFRAVASERIAAHAAPLIGRFAPARIASYSAMRSEADPHPIVAALGPAPVEIGLPAIAAGGALVFRRFVAGDPLVSGGFGTMVPLADAPVIEPDLIIVPTVGFDRALTRLGYGKGHYDRAIAALRAAGRHPVLVGIAFAAQEVDPIPREPHDVTLDFIVTEEGLLGPSQDRS